jgi:AcrR family transcriptional regulator
MTFVLPELGGATAEELSRIERIRNAALKTFGTYGTSVTSLRKVAEVAGVSVGLVQHHFTNKAGLIKAVDDYVLSVVVEVIAQPMSGPPADSLDEMGARVTHIVAAHPDVVDYFGRALIDGSPLGAVIFDMLMNSGTARWHQRTERGESRPDIDVTWAAINSLMLALGTLSMRNHVERHLPAPLATPAQLERWQASVNTLLRRGLFQPGDRP